MLLSKHGWMREAKISVMWKLHQELIKGDSKMWDEISKKRADVKKSHPKP